MEPGQQVQETYLASSKEMRTTKQGKPFLKLKLSDRTGTVDGVLWDDAEEAARLFEQGDHIQVSGQISEYAGSAQVKINNIQPVSPTQVDPHDFLPSTYRDIEELQGYLRFHMESVHDRDYRRLLDHVFNDSEFLERFTRAPAATRYHHAYLECGSPTRPKTLEALIIHHIDNLDAKVKGFLEIVEGSRNAEWTDLRNLFRRPLHIPRAAHQEEDLIPPVRPEDSEERGPEESGPEERG